MPTPMRNKNCIMKILLLCHFCPHFIEIRMRTSFSAFEFRCLLDCFWISQNCGMGDASQNSEGLEAAIKIMSLSSGQRPMKTKARQAIASFKLRERQTVGIMVTLRGKVRFSLLVWFWYYSYFVWSPSCVPWIYLILQLGFHMHLDMHPFAMLLFYGPRMDGFN